MSLRFSAALLALALVACGDDTTEPASAIGSAPNLVLAYGLDEGTGTVAHEASGGPSGTVSGATWTAGKYGDALSFHAGTNVVTVPKGATVDNIRPITACAWMNPRSQGGQSDGRILHKGSQTARWQLNIDSGTTRGIGFVVNRSGGQAKALTVNGVFAFNAWTYVCGTFSDTDGPRVWVNGLEASYASRVNPSGTDTSDAVDNLYIGNRPGLDKGFDGLLDEVRIYSRVLSPTEMQTDMVTPIDAPDAGREAGPDADADADAEASADVEAEAEAAPETGPDVVEEPDVAAEAEASVDASEPEPEAAPDVAEEPDVIEEPEAAPDAGEDVDATVEAGDDATAEAGPEPEPEAGPDAPPDASESGPAPMGPLVNVGGRWHRPDGTPIMLAGSHTWDDMQDEDTSSSPGAFDFAGFVSALTAHHHNATILWRKDLPTFCNWGAGGTWHIAEMPWMRTGPGTASDGLPAFDLNAFDQAYFDRLLSRVQTLEAAGIYPIVQLFDGLQLLNNRCATDGYPFTGGNNINGIDDGGGTGSMTMTASNAITGYQDALVRKFVDTLYAEPGVLWEISEEAPSNSTWWQAHMIALLDSYDAAHHPVGYPMLTGGADSTLYNSNADWVAPSVRLSPTASCGAGTPTCKVNINDSDHTYFGMWLDSAQQNRAYVWENITQGNGVLFMDPFDIYWSSGSRNLCSGPVNGVCPAPSSRWDNLRDNLGYALSYVNGRLDFARTVARGSLSSTGYCLANAVASGAEYLVYAPSGGGGSINVDLSATTATLNVEWLDPSAGTVVSGAPVMGGSTTSFVSPFTTDAVLYLVDSAGHQ